MFERLCKFCLRKAERGSDACKKCQESLNAEGVRVSKETRAAKQLTKVAKPKVVAPDPVKAAAAIVKVLESYARPSHQSFVHIDIIVDSTGLPESTVKHILKSRLRSKVESGNTSGYKKSYRLKGIQDSINRAISDMLNGVPIKPTVEKLTG